jgi:glycosyltransferase involved in cell wall biosynthesis
MHVCFCYHHFYPVQGGGEVTIMNISRRLIQNGHKVTVVTSNVPNRPEREIIEGIEVLRAKPLFNIFKVPIMPKFKRLLGSVKPDIINAYGTIPGVSDVAILHAKGSNIPCVLSYQFDGNAESPLGTLAAHFYNRFINRRVVKKADKLIATSRSYAETSPVLKDFMAKTEILPTDGIDINELAPQVGEASLREAWDLPSSNLILWVGRFVKYKGLEYVIRAMKYVQDGTLVIAGGGKLEKQLKKLVHEDGLDEKVKFLGLVPYENMPKLFRASTIYVLSSITRGENFGRTALEAMACGIPVIASDLPGVRELVTDDCGIKVKPKDVNGLAESINLLLSRPGLRLKMAQNGRRNAEKYDWEKIVERLTDIYEDLIKSKKMA